MPCYRCGVRQSDPVRGASQWKRGVRGEALVLACPDCQESRDWVSDLDRCERCDSTELLCRLGEVECRDCGWSKTAGGRAGQPAGEGVPGLSEEVASALERLLGRARRTAVR